jgi:hypothetical protein
MVSVCVIRLPLSVNISQKNISKAAFLVVNLYETGGIGSSKIDRTSLGWAFGENWYVL